MPRVRLTTDMGDWHTVPWRIRLGFLVMVVGAVGIGGAFGLGLLSLGVLLLAFSVFAVAWVVMFDRRRPWWPDEPTVPVDPVARGARRNISMAIALATVTVILWLTGVLR